MSRTPDFANPPIVELVLGAQFSPLASWQSTVEPTQPSAKPWSTTMDHLLALRLLEDDWDGQGAEAPAPALVDAAISLALRLAANGVSEPDFAVAGVNGTVHFEWKRDSIEIEVLAPDRAEMLTWKPGMDRAEQSFIALNS